MFLGGLDRIGLGPPFSDLSSTANSQTSCHSFIGPSEARHRIIEMIKTLDEVRASPDFEIIQIAEQLSPPVFGLSRLLAV